MASESEKENPYAKIPNCVVYSLMIFTFILILIGGGLVWMFYRMIGRYEFIQSLIDHTPSGETVETVMENAKAIRDKKREEYNDRLNKFNVQLEEKEKRMNGLKEEFDKAYDFTQKSYTTKQELFKSTADRIQNNLGKYGVECNKIVETYDDARKVCDKSIEELIKNVGKFNSSLDARKKDLKAAGAYTAKDLVPEDFIYFQIDQEKNPNELWKDCNWQEVDESWQDCFLYNKPENMGKVDQESVPSPEEFRKDYFTHVLSETFLPEVLQFKKPRPEIPNRNQRFGLKSWENPGQVKEFLKPKISSAPLRIYHKKDKAKAWSELK